MGKKFTIQRFVKVMSGSKIQLDETAKVARENASIDCQQLQAMIAQLASVGVSSTQLDLAWQAYFTDYNAALALKSKPEQEKAFNNVARTISQEVKAAKKPFDTWLLQAQEQDRRRKALDQTLTAKQGEVDRIPIDKVKSGLTKRIAEWRNKIPLSKEVTGLPRALAGLEQIEIDLGDADIDRFIVLSDQLQTLGKNFRIALKDAATRVKIINQPQLTQIVSNRLLEIRKQEKVLLGPVSDLFDLVNKCQDLTDLSEELGGMDVSKFQDAVALYAKTEQALRVRLQADAAKLSKFMDAPFKKELQGDIDTCLKVIVPLSDIGNLSHLENLLKSIQNLQESRDGFDKKLADVKAYEEHFVKSKEAYSAKQMSAQDLPESPIRDQMLKSLFEINLRIAPIADLKSMEAVRSGLMAIEAIRKSLEGFDIEKYQQLADPFQDEINQFFGELAAKRKEIEALPKGSARSYLEVQLEKYELEAIPLGKITNVDSIGTRTSTMSKMKTQVLQLDVGATSQAVAGHEKALADAKTKMEKKLADLAKGLSSNAQKLLREEFTTQLDYISSLTSVDRVQQELQSIQRFVETVEQREIKVSKELELRLKKADDRIAKAQKQIDKLATPELKKAAKEALNDLSDKLDHVRIGKDVATMKTSMMVGDPAKPGYFSVELKASEQTRVIDSAIKALSESIADPSGKGAKMLEFEGGEKLSTGLCDMYATLVSSGGSHKGISPAEALAIRNYTGKDYSAMNRNRRGISEGDKEADDRLSFLNEVCDEAVEKMPPYPAVAWPTFRIETAWSQDVVDKRYGHGRQFTCGILWSTGARGVAAINLKGSPTFTHVIYGKKGKDVAALSANPHEGAMQQAGYDFNPSAGRGEVLFPADSAFLVKERTDPIDKDTGKPMVVRFDPDQSGVPVTTTLKEASND